MVPLRRPLPWQRGVNEARRAGRAAETGVGIGTGIGTGIKTGTRGGTGIEIGTRIGTEPAAPPPARCVRNPCLCRASLWKHTVRAGLGLFYRAFSAVILIFFNCFYFLTFKKGKVWQSSTCNS